MFAPPAFPLPIHAEPSAPYVMELIQRFEATWTRSLAQANVPELGGEWATQNPAERDDLLRRFNAIHPDYRAQLASMGQDTRPLARWAHHREVYEPHPAMSRALVRMKSDAEVPGTVFTRLPHPNPAFLLPGAPPITHADDHPGRILAIFISGATARRHEREGDSSRLSESSPGNASVLMDTHNPHANAFHAMVVSEVHDLEGTQVIDLDWCHLTVPIRTSFNLDDLAFAIAADGFNWSLNMREDDPDHDRRFQYLLTIAAATVSHLLYACSRTVELDAKPRASRPPAKRKKGQPKPPPSARIRRMGWRTGAAIADSTRRQAAAEAAPGTGRKVVPHMRAAHLHLYRVGPGRREIELKWLDPIPVNATADDGHTITSHPMH